LQQHIYFIDFITVVIDFTLFLIYPNQAKFNLLSSVIKFLYEVIDMKLVAKIIVLTVIIFAWVTRNNKAK
ncbi:hypothetical protein, partial [Staphylococcus haemolyticus]|uniref:hypothetical protein n=1 Tax=Staphylococcus haemolyticus TaxID=1283 RepID=UPI0030C2ACF1